MTVDANPKWQEYLDAAAPVLSALAGTHRSVARRRRVAADILLGAAWSTGTDWPGIVGWLRGFARGLTAEGHGVRLEAEQAYARNQEDWLGQQARAREALGRGDNPYASLYRLHTQTWLGLRAAAEAGRLGSPPTEAFHQLLGAGLRGPLGLPDEQSAEIACILSLAQASAGPRQPFFTDAPTAADRQYHEHSKYFAFRGADQMVDETPGETQGRWPFPPATATIELPRPRPGADGGPGLPEVLAARRSRHGRYHGRYTLEELGVLLYHSAAVTASKTLPGGRSAQPARNHPSGGGRYPIRLVLYCHEVPGVPRGLYLYDPERHALDELSRQDASERLLLTSPWLDPRLTPPKATGRIDARECPLWIFPVADLTYQRLAYGLRAYRLALVECGHLVQNLALVSAWQGRACIGIGGYFDDAVDDMLGVDGATSSALYVCLLGDVEPLDLRRPAGGGTQPFTARPRRALPEPHQPGPQPTRNLLGAVVDDRVVVPVRQQLGGQPRRDGTPRRHRVGPCAAACQQEQDGARRRPGGTVPCQRLQVRSVNLDEPPVRDEVDLLREQPGSLRGLKRHRCDVRLARRLTGAQRGCHLGGQAAGGEIGQELAVPFRRRPARPRRDRLAVDHDDRHLGSEGGKLVSRLKRQDPSH